MYYVLFYRVTLPYFFECVLFPLLFVLVLKAKLMQSRRHINNTIWLIEYIWAIFCYTVICRKKWVFEQFFPLPFYDYGKHQFGVMWSEMIMNVLMFVPLGVLLKLAFKQARWYHVTAVGFMLSASIETLQFIFKCGSCETNDLINNTIGSIIGYWIIKKNSK